MSAGKFNTTNNFSNSSEGSYDRNSLLMIVELFIEVEQFQTAEGLLRTIPEYQQTSQAKHYVIFILYI